MILVTDNRKEEVGIVSTFFFGRTRLLDGVVNLGIQVCLLGRIVDLDIQVYPLGRIVLNLYKL